MCGRSAAERRPARRATGGNVIDLTDDLIAALVSPKVQEELRRTVASAVRAELRARPAGGARLVGAEEAATVLGMTPTAVRKAATRGTIPAERVGRRLRFRLTSLMGIGATRR